MHMKPITKILNTCAGLEAWAGNHPIKSNTMTAFAVGMWVSFASFRSVDHLWLPVVMSGIMVTFIRVDIWHDHEIKRQINKAGITLL